MRRTPRPLLRGPWRPDLTTLRRASMESDQRLHAAEKERDSARDGEARALLELEAATKMRRGGGRTSGSRRAVVMLMEARSHDDGGDAARRALAEVRKELDGVRAELLRERHAHFERAEPPDDGGDVGRAPSTHQQATPTASTGRATPSGRPRIHRMTKRSRRPTSPPSLRTRAPRQC